MISKTLKNGLLSAALVCAAMLSAGPAAAKSYSLTLDPAFGEPFPFLSWSVKGTVDVGADCTSLTNNFYDLPTPASPPFGACSSSDITFGSVLVTFYETNNDSNKAVYEVGFGSVSVNRITIFNNELTEIDAGFFTTFTPIGTDSIFGIAGEGLTGFALKTYGSGIAGDTVNSGRITWFKNTFVSSPQGCGPDQYAAKTCGESNPAQLFINPVPEPQTYALMLAALAALGLTSRRRRMV